MGDEIDKNSQRANMSTDTYQEWAHVLELGGGSASSLTTATKTLSNVITDAGNGGASAAEKLNSIGLSYEQIAELSPEEQFEAVVYALADMEEGSERTAAAQDLLGRAGMDLIPTLNSGKEAIEDMRAEAHDLGLVLSEDTLNASVAFNDSLTTLKGAVTGIAGNLMGELMPGLQGVTDGLVGFVSGSMSAEEATTMMSEGVQSLLETVTTMLTEGIPMLLEMAVQLFMAIVDALPTVTTALAEALPNIITTIITSLVGAIPDILEGAVATLMAIVDAIPVIIVSLVEALPEIINTVLNALFDSISLLFDAATTFLMAIVEAIPTIVIALVGALPQILTTIINTLASWITELFNEAKEVGNSIVSGVKQGILDVWDSITSWLKSKVTGLINSMKSWIGFGSPAKEFIVIGESMGEGLAVGWEDTFEDLDSAALTDIENFVNDVNAGLAGIETAEIGYDESAIGNLESVYGNMAAAGLTAQSQNAAETTTIHTQVNIGGTKFGEIVYSLYNQQARIAGQPVFVYT